MLSVTHKISFYNGCEIRYLKVFFKDKKQTVSLKGQRSSLADLEAGAPKGSILGHYYS